MNNPLKGGPAGGPRTLKHRSTGCTRGGSFTGCRKTRMPGIEILEATGAELLLMDLYGR